MARLVVVVVVVAVVAVDVVAVEAAETVGTLVITTVAATTIAKTARRNEFMVIQQRTNSVVVSIHWLSYKWYRYGKSLSSSSSDDDDCLIG